MVRPHTPDVCIAGGGPAGLSAAIALRNIGCSVAVLDSAYPPIDKSCGEGLLPEALTALDRLGISLPTSTGCQFTGIRFSDESSSVSAEFCKRPAIGVRRTTLHRVLTEHAMQMGVDLRWGVKGIRATRDGIFASGELLKPPLIVGADGQNSMTRKLAGIGAYGHQVRRYGFRRHYRIAPWSPYMEFYWGDGAQIYVTPVAQNEIGVALISRDPKLRLDQALKKFPQVAHRLSAAEPCSAEMGAVTVTGRLSRVYCAPATKLRFAPTAACELVLIGDASGSVDAITGDGIALAFRQAFALADAFKSGKISRYQQLHRALFRRPARMACLLLLLDKYPVLRRRTLAALAKRPEVFDALLNIHAGQSSIGALYSWNAVCTALNIMQA